MEPDIHQRTEQSATIQKIANNLLLAATEIQLLRKKIRSLHYQITQIVFSDELAKHDTNLLDGATGNQLTSAIGLMDSPITEALEKGSAPEALELWRLHSEHFSQVHANGGKGQGRKRVAYHPLLLNWAIAFLACTSSRVYGEVAKIMMLPNISHVYRKTAKLIFT
jgi:hypothetical protein